jgi:hypothetical protein
MYGLSRLTPTPSGLMFAGVLLVKRAPDGTLAISWCEDAIMAQLAVASGRPASADMMRCLRCVGYWFGKVSDMDLEYADYPFFPSPHQPVAKQGEEFPAIVMLQTSLTLNGFSVTGARGL